MPLPQAKVTMACTLRRRIGSPITAETLAVGPAGMRVACSRPLAVDEMIDFDIPNLDIRVNGHARVLRQERLSVYVLRFERLPEPMTQRLHALAINSR